MNKIQKDKLLVNLRDIWKKHSKIQSEPVCALHSCLSEQYNASYKEAVHE